MIIEPTSSVFILRRNREDGWLVALVWHPRLECWLPAGGHVENGETPAEAAIREAQEETGLDVTLVPVPAVPVPTAFPHRLVAAPWLVAVFAQKYGKLPDGRKVKHYYPTESVGLATGMLITALHHAGLATLTHTPSPMKFLNEILRRPTNERPFLLLVTGYPAADAQVPDIARKPLEDVADFV